LVLFSGCTDRTYSRIYQKELIGKKVSAISLSCEDKKIKDIVVKAFKNSQFKLDKNSLYEIKVDYLKYCKSCNNPMTNAYDATYDGYFKLTLLKNRQKVYMCQKDFHGDFDEGEVEKLIDLMVQEMEI